MSGRILRFRAGDALVPAVVAEDEHDGIPERGVALETAEEALELDVDVAQRRHVPVGLGAQRRDVGMGHRHRERMVSAGGQAGEEIRTPARAERVDFHPQAIEQCPVGDAEPNARRAAWKAALVEERMRRTTGFYAVVDESAGACKGSTPAPGGCVSMTTSGTAGVPITVSIPHR